MKETELGIIKVGYKVKHQVNYDLLLLYKNQKDKDKAKKHLDKIQKIKWIVDDINEDGWVWGNDQPNPFICDDVKNFMNYRFLEKIN